MFNEKVLIDLFTYFYLIIFFFSMQSFIIIIASLIIFDGIFSWYFLYDYLYHLVL